MSDIAELAEFPGYGVSRDGRGWSKWVMGSKYGRLRDEWQELKLSPAGPMGYLRISPRKNGRTHYRDIHRLILETFGGPPPSPDHQARHADGDHLNNHADNMVWGTRSENEQDKRRHGTYQYGENNTQSKLTESDISMIRLRSVFGESNTSIGADFGVCRHTIGDIVKNRSWTHV